jgi:hypothetical protein
MADSFAKPLVSQTDMMLQARRRIEPPERSGEEDRRRAQCRWLFPTLAWAVHFQNAYLYT